ncbi:MAG: hypothetical protein V1725_04335 [archaeon]
MKYLATGLVLTGIALSTTGCISGGLADIAFGIVKMKAKETQRTLVVAQLLDAGNVQAARDSLHAYLTGDAKEYAEVQKTIVDKRSKGHYASLDSARTLADSMETAINTYLNCTIK